MIAPPSHSFSNASFFLFIVILIGTFTASTRATFLFSPTSSPSSQTAAQLDYFYSPSRKRKAERALIVNWRGNFRAPGLIISRFFCSLSLNLIWGVTDCVMGKLEGWERGNSLTGISVWFKERLKLEETDKIKHSPLYEQLETKKEKMYPQDRHSIAYNRSLHFRSCFTGKMIFPNLQNTIK